MPENNQDPPESELGPPKDDFSAPPPYELINSQQMQLPLNQQSPSLTDICMHHGKLPTYEEVQKEKSMNGELPPAYLTTNTLQQPTLVSLPSQVLCDSTGTTDGDSSSARATTRLTFFELDTSDAENLTNLNDSNTLGTDIMFITSFMVAFLFNWIGFLMLTCFCHTIAGRYGALSGFGLSLAKWTLIMKNSNFLDSQDNSWVWWLLTAFGFLIFIRPLIQYISIKRTWRLMSSTRQAHLFSIY